MDFTKIKTISQILLIVLGFAIIFPLSAFMENEKPALPAGFEDSDLALQGSKLKGFSLGMEGLLADFYWMQALQYIGNKIINSEENIDINDLRPLNPRLLYPYLDNATTLDPNFMEAYSYGAIVLPAIDKQKAIAIARKGIKNNPKEWRLYQHLGYIYWRLGEYEKAGQVYSEGAKIESAPPFLKMIALRMNTQGESRETAREIYQQMFEQTKDRQIKDFAKSRMLYMQSLDETEEINSILENLSKNTRECVGKLSEIIPALQKSKSQKTSELKMDNEGNLYDPTGVPYLFERSDCKIEVDRAKTKLPLS